MTKRVATLILNRNLPDVTDRLYESLEKTSGAATDLYVVESGSSPDGRSQYASFVADWEESLTSGLRYGRGFNYGLCELHKSDRFRKYEYFFLVCNDAVFPDPEVVPRLLSIMERHSRLGILSPCGTDWAEQRLLGQQSIKYFWYINHVAWFVRRDYIASVMETESPNHMNFLYDGSNFRGYESDIELIAKAYANDFGAGITTEVRLVENEEILKTQHARMRTDEYHKNREQVFAEGKRWMRRKYGFNSRWSMQLYAQFWYEKFFEFHPQLAPYRI